VGKARPADRGTRKQTQQRRAPAARSLFDTECDVAFASGRDASLSDGASRPLPPLEPLPDDRALPVLAVHLDVAAETLAFRLPAKAGTSRRWSGKYVSMDDLMPAAFAAGCPAPCVIAYLEKRT
jgi:hypothetical protein